MAPRKYLSLRFIVKARHLTINLLLLPLFFLSIWCLYLSIFSRSCQDTVRYAEVSGQTDFSFYISEAISKTTLTNKASVTLHVVR